MADSQTLPCMLLILPAAQKNSWHILKFQSPKFHAQKKRTRRRNAHEEETQKLKVRFSNQISLIKGVFSTFSHNKSEQER